MPRKKVAAPAVSEAADAPSEILPDPVQWTVAPMKAPPDLSPALAEPQWVADFCSHAVTAFTLVRDYHDNPSLSDFVRLEQRSRIGFNLKLLFDHIMTAWNRRAEAGVYISVESDVQLPPGVIDGRVRQAYIEAHEMFVEIERRQKANPTKMALPVSPLTRINSLLAAVQADSSRVTASNGATTMVENPNAERNRWLHDQYVNHPKKTLRAIRDEAKSKGWFVRSNQALEKAVASHCKSIPMDIPKRKRATTKPK
jgi:hypothetical protein